MAKAKHDPAAVDEYLAGLPADRRDALEELRQLIHAYVPDLRERISYGTAVILALKATSWDLCPSRSICRSSR